MGKIKEIETYTTKIKEEQKILIVSDWHREINSGQENLNKIKQQIKHIFSDINLILFAGDLLNDVNDLEDPVFEEIFIEALKEFIGDKKVYITLGNHDKMTRITSKNRNNASADSWMQGNEKLLIDTLKKIENVEIIRNNQIYKIGNIKIGSFSPNANYYLTKKESKEEYEKQFFANFDETKFDEETYNIFLTHEPHSIIELSKERKKCIQPQTDLVVSGHMHNGLLPTIMHNFIKNNGLISPQMEILPSFAQGEYSIEDTDFIINGAINTRVETPLINKLYGANATLLTIKPTLERKKIKRIN